MVLEAPSLCVVVTLRVDHNLPNNLATPLLSLWYASCTHSLIRLYLNYTVWEVYHLHIHSCSMDVLYKNNAGNMLANVCSYKNGVRPCVRPTRRKGEGVHWDNESGTI